jgi:hypothetical protein
VVERMLIQTFSLPLVFFRLRMGSSDSDGNRNKKHMGNGAH